MKKVLLALVLLLAATPLFAQTLTFTAENTTGNGTVVPKLTWSTTPAATGCTASGDWSGSKAAAGTETLPAISVSKTYNLTCSFAAPSSAVLTWVIPTTNTDGSPYTDAKGFLIYGATSAAALATVTPRNHFFPTSTSTPYTGLTVGTWFFCVKAVNQLDAASACSNVVSKTIAAGSQNKSVGITVNPVPNAPTALTVE